MLEHLLTVSNQVLILFIMIAVGFISLKAKLINKEHIRSMTNFVLFIVTPCVIIESFQRSFDKDMLSQLGLACITAIIIHLVSIVLVHLVLHDQNKARECVLRFSSVFCNCGYMALPLQYAILGSDGVFLGAAYVAVFNLFSWTYGIYLMGDSAERISLKKIFINPGIIGVSLGLIFFLFQIKIPKIPLTVIHSFANLNTPLPMVIIGCYLADITGFEILKDKKMLFSLFLRLIFIPVTAVFVMHLCNFSGNLYVSLVISAASPVAANTAMYASLFNRDTTLASSTVSISTLFSIFTMPVIVSLALYLAN
jgi:predicted permease